MNAISKLLSKLFILAVSSVIASLVIITTMAVTSSSNEKRIEEIRREIEDTKIELERIHWRIENWPKNWNWKNKLGLKLKIKEYQIYTIPKLNSKIAFLYGELSGLDTKFKDIFVVNCKQHLLLYSIRIFVLLLCLPLILSLLMYYCIAPLIERIAPIRALKKSDNSSNLQMNTARAVLNVNLDDNEHLYLRGDWIGLRVDANVKTKFMWKRNAPLITFAADLFELKEYWSKNNRQGNISITAPATDLYIGEINLQNNRAVVIRPRYLVGVSDGIKIRTFWNFSLHNILAGKIRQVILYGNGRIFVYGYQGVNNITAEEKDYRNP